MRIFLFLLFSTLFAVAQPTVIRRGGATATNHPGTIGQVLLTDGTNAYWGDPTGLSASDTNAISRTAGANAHGTNTSFHGVITNTGSMRQVGAATVVGAGIYHSTTLETNTSVLEVNGTYNNTVEVNTNILLGDLVTVNDTHYRLRPGTYFEIPTIVRSSGSAAINLLNKTNVLIEGYPGRTVISGVNDIGELLWVSNCNNVTIRGITFRSQVVTNWESMGVPGALWASVGYYKCANLKFENCFFDGGTDHGLMDFAAFNDSGFNVPSTNNIQILNNRFYNFGSSFVLNTNGDGNAITPTGGRIEGNYISDCLLGIEPYLTPNPANIINNLIIRNNIIENCLRYGIFTGSATNHNNMVIEQNTIIYGYQYSRRGTNIYPDADGININGGQRPKIKNNIIAGARGNGITFGSSVPVNGAEITGNLIYDQLNSPVGGGIGILAGSGTTLATASSGILIGFNTIYNSRSKGLYINGIRDSIITGNNLYNPINTDGEGAAFQFGNIGVNSNLNINGNQVFNNVGTRTLGLYIDTGNKKLNFYNNRIQGFTQNFTDLSTDGEVTTIEAVNNAWGAGRGAMEFFDGTTNVYFVGILTNDTPINGQVPKWNTGGFFTLEADNVGAGGGGVLQVQTNGVVVGEQATNNWVASANIAFLATNGTTIVDVQPYISDPEIVDWGKYGTNAWLIITTNVAQDAVTVAAGSLITVTTNVTSTNTIYTIAGTAGSGTPVGPVGAVQYNLLDAFYGTNEFNYTNRSIGLGTNQPQANLHIVHSTPVIFLEDSNAVSNPTLFSMRGTGIGSEVNQANGVSNWVLYVNGADTISVRTNGLFPAGVAGIAKNLGSTDLAFFSNAVQHLWISNSFKFIGGTLGAGKVLTSDANGIGTWETPAGGAENTGTNVNQFGAAGAILTLKDGLMGTNFNIFGTLSASNLVVTNVAGFSGSVTNTVRTPTQTSSNILFDGSLGNYFVYTNSIHTGGSTNVVFTNLVIGQTVVADVYITNATVVLKVNAVEFPTNWYIGNSPVAVASNGWSRITVLVGPQTTNIQVSSVEFVLGVAGAGSGNFLALTTNYSGATVSVSNTYIPQASSMVLSNIVGSGALTNASAVQASSMVLSNLVATGARTNEYNFLWIPASGMISNGSIATSTGATNGLFETTTNKRLLDMFSFDDTASNAVQVAFALPYDWDTATALQVKLHWTSTNAQASETVAWGVGTVSTGDDGVIDTAFGTEVVITDDVTAANDMLLTAASSDITTGGSAVAGAMISLQIRRLGSHASDDCDGLARLIGAHIRYKKTRTLSTW